MGVSGLRAYTSRKIIKPPIRKMIYIREEIQQWKRANGKRPKLLIDLKDIAHMVVQSRKLQCCIGGQYSLYTNYYRNLFKKFENAGADLVFFAAGRKLSDEVDIVIPQLERDYIAYISILDEIDANEGKWCKTVEPKYKKRAPLTMQFNMMKLAQQHGELRINYVRHNQQIAQYAMKHADTILAIISNDTDFLVFEGDYQCWRATDIISKELTAFRFCRETLRTHLQLNTQQLELLSALAGNEYLPGAVLTDFYEKIGIENYAGGHIPALAKYIREEVSLLPTAQENAFRFDLQKVARDIFGENYTRDDLYAIENGLIQYNLNFTSGEIYPYERAAMDFCKKVNMFIFKLVTDDVFLIKDISFIDYRHYKSKNYAELIIPLLRKLQGILYANERRRPKTRAVCMKYAHDEPFKVVDEPIVYPSARVPGLFDLVFKTKEQKFNGVRWALFDWLFEFGRDFEESLKRLDKKYTVAVVTIKYLLTQGEITAVEADAFLITENFVRERNYASRDLEDSTVLNTHFIRLANLYTKMFCLINHCLEVCGLHPYTTMIMFDGPFFHNTLQSLISKKEQMTNALRRIQKYRIYSD